MKKEERIDLRKTDIFCLGIVLLLSMIFAVLVFWPDEVVFKIIFTIISGVFFIMFWILLAVFQNELDLANIKTLDVDDEEDDL